ncbi:MAG: class I SAM-dependent methyltransferase [Bryobacteraceae bacterium]|jgi:SAM-dependent methyltransferase
MSTTQPAPERIGEWLESVLCPVCCAERFEVLQPARYPADASVAELKEVYRASSDRAPLDQIVRCRSCSMVYLNPRPIPALVLSGYAEAVDPMFVAQNAARIRAFSKTLGSVLRRLKLDGRGRRLLDVGCAGGAFLVAAQRCGFETVGVEPSHWLASYARDQYRLDVRDGVLEPGLFPPRSFDVVTLWDVVEHLSNPHDTLALAASLLKPGGLLLVNYPDIGSLAARMLGHRWPFWLGVHLLYYTRTTIARQLERGGFRIVDFRPFFPTLPLGYVAHRAAPYVPGMGAVAKLLERAGLAKVPLIYNIGQTLAVARLN